jgi:hypothetical protein
VSSGGGSLCEPKGLAERDPVEEVKEAMLPSEEWCECEDEVMLE